MGIANPPGDPANIVQALVYTLSGVFDATRDLYRNLTVKEQREHERNLRIKSYPASRRVEYVKDERLGSDEAITTDKSTVVRQFEIGYQVLGADFAMGDVIAHTELQSQIIALQSVLVTTCLHGPSSTDPIAHQLSNINAASRAAAATSIEILAALQERQIGARPLTPRSMHSVTARSSPLHAPLGVPSQHMSHVPSLAPSQPASRARSITIFHAPSHAPSHMPSHTGSRTPPRGTSRASSQVPSRVLALPQPPNGTSSASTAIMKYGDPQLRSSYVRSSSPVNTTVLDWRSKVEPESVVTGTTSTTGPTSSAVPSASGNLYCRYAYDLQRDPTQQLHDTVISSKVPYCPHCKGDLHLSLGKAWEVFKWAGDTERTFQVHNRFVVKCHRDGPDGQYCCVICSEYSDSDTVCGDVKALVKHLSDEHEVRELKHEEDIMEVVEQAGSRRDSGIGYGSCRGSRRSASLASGRGRRRKSLPGYEREVDVFETRSSRR